MFIRTGVPLDESSLLPKNEKKNIKKKKKKKKKMKKREKEKQEKKIKKNNRLLIKIPNRAKSGNCSPGSW